MPIDKDKKRAKRIVKAKIAFISLCPKGANSFSTIYKADDGDTPVDLSTICKDMNEQGEIIALVYAPETVDSQGDIASAAVIKEFAHDFAKNGEGIDVRHNEEVLSKDAVYVAESFIVQKGDPRFADMKDYDGDSVDATGGWGVVIKVDDEEIRKLYREGEWGGVSMGGVASKTDNAIGDLVKMFKEYFNLNKKEKKSKNNNTENNMALSKEDKTEVAELVAKTMETANKKIEDAKAEEVKKAKEAEDADGKKLGLNFAEPVLKDRTEKGLDEHRRNLEIFELSKKVDSTDSRAIFDFQEQAHEIAKCKDLNETLNKQSSSQYDSFYTSGGDTEEISKLTGDYDDNDGGMAKLIEKSLDDAEKEAAK